MSAEQRQAADMPEDERRILLARKELYQSGNSVSVSIPPDTLENTPFDIGEHAAIFSLPEERELAITADTRRYYNQGAMARGSRKIRENSHGTVLISIPPESLEDDLGFEEDDDAKGVEVKITLSPATRDLFLEFPD